MRRVGQRHRWVQATLLLVAALAPFGAAGDDATLRPVEASLVEFVDGGSIRADAPPRIDLIRVDKSERVLELLSSDVVVAQYRVALGSKPTGAKEQQGDGRTPEGRYRIDWRKSDSDYHRALHISYPNADDRARARTRGVDPGGAIMIHGLPNGLGIIGSAHVVADWTDGCIAVTNAEIEEIWEWVSDGVPIEIMP